METWSGLIEIPYDDFLAGIEAIKTLEIIETFVKTKKYLDEDDIARIIGLPVKEEE